MKTANKLLLTIFCATLLMLSHTSFGQNLPQSLTNLAQTSTSSDIVAAINQLRADVLTAVNTNVMNQLQSMNKQVTTLFDNTFKGTFDPATKKLVNFGTLFTLVNLYTNNFYSWYVTKVFSDIDFTKKNDNTAQTIKQMFAKELGYTYQTDITQKLKDDNALLAQTVENGNNNIDALSLGVNLQDKNTNPYGGLADNALSADNAPTLDDLIGPSNYSDDTTKNKAKLFISYVLKSVPPPKTFFIPDKSTAVNNKVTIYLPYPSKNLPYTPVEVSTKAVLGKSEYDKMVTYLNQDAKYYQPYKMKTRSVNALRTLYLESMLRSFSERVVDSKDNKSLVDKEKEAAMAGLDKKYYDDLKSKTMADVNLEILYALNKLTYFIYKLHQDNERNSLVIATSGLQLASQDSKDEQTFVKPIGAMFENHCWNVKDDPNAKQDVVQICNDPGTGAAQPKSPN